MREQISELLRSNPDADYWEKLVLRYAEALLAEVDEQLRGIPVEEAGLVALSADDYLNLPDTIEMLNGIPTPKHWRLRQEDRHRLGWSTPTEEWEELMLMSGDEIRQEMARRRAELRAKPFVPSQVPFPNGPPEE